MLGSHDYRRLFWLGLALVLCITLAVVLYRFIGTLVFGLFLYYASRPIYARLRRRIGPASPAAAGALFALVLPVLLLVWYTVALGLGELESLAGADLSGLEELLGPYVDSAGSLEELRTIISSLIAEPGRVLQEEQLRSTLRRIAATVAGVLGQFLGGLLRLFIALAVAFYLLRDGDRLAGWIRATFDDDTLDAFGRAVDTDLQTVFFGNILNALLTVLIGTVVFTILAVIAPPTVPVPVPILLGLLAGVGSLVPVVGMKIVYIPVVLYLAGLAFLSDPASLWFPAVFFVVTTILVDLIPDLVLRPYVSGRDLHVGLVTFSYILGPLLFGWYGLFLGPLVLVVLTHFAEIVVPVLTGTATVTDSPVTAAEPYGAPTPAGATARPTDAATGPPADDADPDTNTRDRQPPAGEHDAASEEDPESGSGKAPSDVDESGGSTTE